MTKNLKNEFYGTQIADLHEMKNYAFTSRGKSIFFAGKEGNWERAEAYAKSHNMKPIAETQGGSTLKTLQNNGILDYATRKGDKKKKVEAVAEDKRRIWNSASRRYAAAVEGKVRTYVCGARPDSIFRRTELLTLLNNKNVKQINDVKRHTLNEFRHQTFTRLREQGMDRRQAAAQARDAVHRKVAIAEIRCDLKQAEKTGNTALYNDCRQRIDYLRTQSKAEIRQKIQAQQQTQSKTQTIDRAKAIHDRAYSQALQKGLSPDLARKAADMRAKHVAERYELNKLRTEAIAKARMSDIKSCIEQRQAHRQSTIRDRQELAAASQQPYKGPALMPDKFREVDQQIKSRELYARAQLEKNYREGNVSARDYKPLQERNEALLSQSRQRDLAGYFQAQPSMHVQSQKSQGSSQDQSSQPSSSQTVETEAASYGYNYAASTMTQNDGKSHNHSSQSQGQSHNHTSHIH